MKRLFGFKRTVLTLTAAAAIVGLAGAAALATNGQKGIISLCFDNTTGEVFQWFACTGNVTWFDIQQPAALSVSKDETDSFPEGPEYHTVVQYQVPAGLYKFEAKANIIATETVSDDTVRADCQMNYLLPGTGAQEQTADTSSFATTPWELVSTPFKGEARTTHGLMAVLDFRQVQNGGVTVNIECRVLREPDEAGNLLLTLNFKGNHMRIIALPLADFSDLTK